MGAQNHALKSSLTEKFARPYYAEVDPEELAAREARDLEGAAAAHLAFAGRFPGGPAKIRAYNPVREQHGWTTTHTVIEIVNDDMPFLVDSVTMEVNRQGLALHFVIHPVLRVVRDAQGELLDVAAPSDSKEGRLESFMHVEVDRQTDPARLAELESGIARALADVRAAVEDWPAMRARMVEVLGRIESARSSVSDAELDEGRAFLAWLLNDHFTFLGSRDYVLETKGGEDVLRIVRGSGLGILRERGETVSTSFATLPPEARKRARVKELLVLTKANARSTVHRPGYLDYVGVKHFNAKGEVTGETRFLGLYTHTVYAENPTQVPILRRKLSDVVARAGLLPAGYSGKALASILEDYPRDELLQIGTEDLYRHAMAILQLGERQRLRLLVRQDAYSRFVSCLIYVPRERYNTELRQRFQKILTEAFNGISSEFDVHLSASTLGRILMRIRTKPGEMAAQPDLKALEVRLVEAMRRWEDDLHDALLERHGEERGNELWRRYGSAFPASYREEYSVHDAVADIAMLESPDAGSDLGMNLQRRKGGAPGMLNFKIYRRGSGVPLSDSVPMLERLGVRVQYEHPHTVEPAGGPRARVVDFGLVPPAGAEIPVERLRDAFHEAFIGMFSRSIEADSLNRLVLTAELSAREISVLRAYARYLRQGTSSFSLAYVEQALAANPRIAALLVRLFVARFKDYVADNEAQLVAQISAALDEVQNLDEDRILRSFLAVIQATTRTNYFLDKPYLSFKLDPKRVPGLPEPRPMFEIWVYSPRVEGVHLRGGYVARGGIRWSDRMEDFRTEVLGLMKAQMVKNVVIVPVGAKGGFVVKQPPAEREALMKEGVACYQTLLRGMLDITDNLVAGKIAPPKGVIRHDGDDGYLVVAADKGTATFSDIANGIAADYGFWLGDAFASGGSAGYDHKKMAITARGAWESVKRHFRELGVNTQTTDFTVAGIGDMSGDVFGNGMLLSRHVRLVAAFDHRHIFLDPAPDAERSFQERERLFRLPRSSWADYDPKLISKGGGVFPRTAKSVPLSPEAQKVLGVEAKGLAPSELISAILRAPVDLLYNGGIGTYLKAKRQSHAEVGDRANDAIRVNGAELRCKVVAEGGNLGFTQLGRVEYALAGGRISTDAIDNSAGVDCSDHEVNIKILLNAVMAKGALGLESRNKLLADMTDEVAALVLRDNVFQTQSLAVSGTLAPALLDVQERFIKSLEKAGRLNRALEYLPDDEELAERRAANLGLTQPERAVLLAYSKIALYDELVASNVPDDAFIATALERYFPAALRGRFQAEIQAHPLRREIIATHVTNSMINRVGSTFVHRMQEETGAAAPDVVRAYLLVREVFGMVDLWRAVEALDYKIADRVQTAMLIDAGRLIVRATLWFLRSRAHLADLTRSIAHFGPGAERLAALLPQILPPEERTSFAAAAGRLEKGGVPPELAARCAAFDFMFYALDVVDVAHAVQRDVEAVARLHFALSGELDFAWLRARVGALPAESHWHTLAKAALRDDLAGILRTLSVDALRASAPEDPASQIAAWKSRNAALYERFRQVLADLRAAETPDFAMLSVAMRELRNLSSR